MVKVKGQLKIQNLQNPIKWKDNALKILGIMIIDLINILGHPPMKKISLDKLKITTLS